MFSNDSHGGTSLKPTLSLVLPCLNESQAIPHVFPKLLACRSQIIQEGGLSDIEIIVVNDGSTDDSLEKLLQYDDQVQIVSHNKCLGYGRALKTGFLNSNGDYLAFYDLDDTCQPLDLIPMLKAVTQENFSLVWGNRMAIETEMPVIRWIGNSIYRWTTQFLLRHPVRDCCSGFRLFHRKHLKHFVEDLPDDLNFTLAMTVSMLRQNVRFREIPIRYAKRMGASKLNPFTHGPMFFGHPRSVRFVATVFSKETPQQNMISENISVLICAYNEEENISRLLVSLAHQSFFSCIKEILIADNNSNDRTLQKAIAIASDYRLPVKFISLQTNNIGRARKLLVQRASTELVAFVDADCFLEPNWLQTLLNHYQTHSKIDSQVVGVGGPNRLPEKNLFQKTINANLNRSLLHGFSAQAHASQGGKPVDHLPTTNALFSRTAIINAGNFDERFGRVGEDLDLGLRLTRSGNRLILTNSPMVENNSAENIVQWTLRMFRFGKAQGLVFGRRSGFLTFFLCACLSTAVFVIGFPTLAPYLFLSFIFSILILSSPAKGDFGHKIQSYLTGIAIWTVTPSTYFLGFLWGLLARVTRALRFLPLPPPPITLRK